MRGAFLTLATAALAVVGTVPRAAATICGQDGVSSLCVSSFATQDVLSIPYQVTQLDGPGSYSVYYVNTTTGTASATQSVGPLSYQQVASGTLYAGIGSCYNVFLVSVPGTSNIAGPVCG